MTRIHPTAIIHPDAKIAPDVRIGPGVVIDGPAEIGPGCVILAHAVLSGWVKMGHENVIGYGAVLGADPQDHAFDPATASWVVLGHHNQIREYATLHRGTAPDSQTTVGNHCFLMVGVHLGHNSQLEDRVVLANNVLLGGHVQVGQGAFLGGSSVFHQFVRVGRQSIIQGNSSMSKDVPPYLIGTGLNCVAGLNTVGLRRSGMTPETRQDIKMAFKLLYKSGLNTTQALAAAERQTWSTEAQEFFTFVAEAKRRGICDLLSREKVDAGETE